MTPLLAVKDLCAGYGPCDVLNSLSITVAPGELWAVLGPNGAGKSTLLKACMGLLPPRSGSVELLGKPLGGWERRALAQGVAWVPQSSEPEVGYTGLDVVLMGRAPHQRGMALASASDVALARSVLEELQVAHLTERAVETLSGGERRMLLLARGLVQEPRLLLLDEPTAFLDLKHQVDVLTRVRARVRQGLGVVAVLHDVNLASGFADRLLLLRQGHAVAQGSPAELLSPHGLELLYGLPMTAARAPNGQWIYAPSGTP